jgi:hypothetical protein
MSNEAQLRFDSLVKRAGKALISVDAYWSGMRRHDWRLLEIRVKGPAVEGGPVLAILKVEVEGVRYVAFNQGDDIVGALAGGVDRFAGKDLKLKEDVYNAGS